MVLPYATVGLAVVLALHHLDSSKVAVPLSRMDKVHIGGNLLLSFGLARAFLAAVGRALRPASSVHLAEWLWLVAWAAVDEIVFYCGHRLLHTPWLYGMVHKRHHKFATPSAWTAFYAHPGDMAFIMAAAYVGPWMTMRVCRVAVPVLSVYMLVAVATFVASHHTTWRKRCAGHFAHHTKFNVNYGNYTSTLDTWLGTRAR